MKSINVLIVKGNKDLLESYLGKLKVVTETKHTITFRTSEKKFKGLYECVKSLGINPYALMSW